LPSGGRPFAARGARALQDRRPPAHPGGPAVAYTYEQLKHMTVMELREVAQALPPEQVQGFTQMHKPHLLEAICRALHIDMFVHHRAVGIEKTEIKTRIRQLKKQRDEAIAAHDQMQVKQIRHQVHALKRQLHRATV
jgi:hypothetical protein